MMTSESEDNGKDTTIEGKETRNCLILASVFLAAFTAYHALQNLQSSLNEEHDLGVFSLSAVYGAFVFSGILAPTVIRYFGIKRCIILSWVCHLIYTISNFYPAFYTLIPSSLLLGGISGFLWTSQSTYITACSYSLAKRTSQETYVVLSKLTGMFYCIFQTTQIPGNLVSSLILKQGTYDNVTTQAVCGADYCPLSTNGTDISTPDHGVVDILLGIFITCDVLALVITLCFLSPLPKSVWIAEASLKDSLSSFFVTLFTTKFIFLVPLLLYMAVVGAFFFGDYTRSYISCPIGIHMVGFVMAAYGATNSFGSFVSSRVAKYTGRYVLFATAALIHAAVFTTLYLWTPNETDTKYIILLPLAWAIADGIFMTQLIALVALYFPDKNEPAFANVHTWMSLGSTLTFALSSILCVYVKLYTMFALLVVGMGMYVVAEILYKMETKKYLNINE
ncbi:protein unc-93 homolog A-like [Haliotis rufescens]|uniref:protein unc-93 homolog A-like n=1 Tax=Haliotis rufescens TaxID=6454 RepID=UPI00201FAD42|nr:protein unc-93 homolog A-like [Haliotis rufescens]